MKIPILPFQLPYESEPVQYLIHTNNLIATVEKGSDTIKFYPTSRSVIEGGDVVRVHIVKFMDKNIKPHYLLVRQNRLFEDEYAHLDVALIVELLEEVDAKYVTETSKEEYEVDDKVMRKYGKPGVIQPGLDGFF
ncbi:MAG: hypothetical protein M5T52_23070 [Ignavibacteriaceae bacterium]|nr:hypothetical protein [Ignavibacteriaceae bacterium]